MRSSKTSRLAIIVFTLGACSAGNPDARLVGQMESDRVEITAEFAEPILERAVREGQRVVAGQLLIRQDTSRIDARIAEANASLEQAGARLDELVRGPRKELIAAARANVRGATEELGFREAEFARAKDLYERELGSPDDLDRARAARDGARASLASLDAKLDELLTGTTVEELRQAEATVHQAQAGLESLEVDRERHFAKAPLAGVIDTLLFEPGERPGPGQPMAILLSGAQAYARVYVPEAIRAHVVPGMAARVYVDGMVAPVKGVVRWVSSEASFTPYFALTEEDRGRLVYPAKVDIEGLSRRLPDGVPVEVELLLDGGVNDR